jgi:hypothetical protein
MTRRSLILVGWLLLSASLPAQSPAKADPLSGTWAGELVTTNGARTIRVTMDLKFDGTRSVSGTVSGLPNPADVKAGTFDPKTGALKLQLGKTSGKEVLLTLEGSVAKGTATGRFEGDESGQFKITRKP